MPAYERSKQNKKVKNLAIFKIALYLLVLLHIMEVKAKASSHEKCLGISEESFHFLPLLQLHFLAAASSDESSIIFSFPIANILHFM